MKRTARILTLACLFLAVSLVHAEPIPSLHASNYVSDFAGVLDASTQAQLNNLCQQIDLKAHAQIALVTIKTTDGQDPVSYAVALYQAWGIGPKSSNRGVLILLAVDDHKYWTTVGYGLEPILPDGKVGGFGREAVPLLRQQDYNGAASLLVARIAAVIAQDAGITLEGDQPQVPAVSDESQRPRRSPLSGIVVAVIIMIVLLVLSSRGGRGSGILSGLLWSLLFSGGGRGNGGGGFGGGGFGGGGGGFGGFGGGSSGGGGAGGSW